MTEHDHIVYYATRFAACDMQLGAALRKIEELEAKLKEAEAWIIAADQQDGD